MARILVVDDDRVNRVLITRLLETADHEVATAASGEAALEIFEGFRPDVVLLDVIMPGMDGFETTRALKRLSGSRYVPILLLTGLSDEESLVRGISAGADDFISKPVNRVVLNSRLYASLRTQGLFARLALQHEELLERQERDDREQRLAERLMSGVMRSEALADPRIRSFSRALALFNGDLLLAEKTVSGGLRLLLGDFVGHGLHAAIGGMPVATMFRQMADAEGELRECLMTINERLRESLPTEMFFAACAMELDARGDLVEIWNCGMPDVLIRGGDGGIAHRVPSSMIPLGISSWSEAWKGTVLSVRPDDRIFIFSDGLFEARDGRGREWGLQSVERMLGADIPTSDVFDELLVARRAFVGDEVENDDVTLVEVLALPAPSTRASERRERSRFEFDLGADLLRRLDLGRFVDGVSSMMPSCDGLETHVGTILAELVSNAVDHGVLGLDSALKRDARGFDEYHRCRDRALDALQRGRVQLEITVITEDRDLRVRVRVRDSGRGFDLQSVGASVESPWGRGLAIVRDLADRLSFLGSGNVVEAEYVARRALMAPR